VNRLGANTFVSAVNWCCEVIKDVWPPRHSVLLTDYQMFLIQIPMKAGLMRVLNKHPSGNVQC